jgi:small conductance mechanosensitive channel
LVDHGTVIGGVIAAVIVADFILARIIPRAFHITARRKDQSEEEALQRAETLSHVFTRTGRSILIIMGFFTILPELGVSIGPLLAGVGIIGLAIGFGAQSLVKDMISGLFIIADNQYGKGDVVRIGDVTGLVENVGLRRTVLRDLDGIVHYIPHGEITISSNFTQDYSRANLDVSVAYGEDLDHVMEVIDAVGQEMMDDPDWAAALITPPKSLRVNNFGDSGIDIKVLCDTQPIRQWEVMGELRRRLKRRFDEVGIEIPFPHRVMVTQGAKATDQPEGATAVSEATRTRRPGDGGARPRAAGEEG